MTDWRCECGDLNREHEAFCYRCGAGSPEDAAGPNAPAVNCMGCGRFVGRDGIDGQCRRCIEDQYNREAEAERRHLSELVT